MNILSGIVVLLVMLGFQATAADKGARNSASAVPASIAEDVKAMVLKKKNDLEGLTKKQLGATKDFSIDYTTLNCLGAPILETAENAVIGVCTFHAVAWQTFGSMAVLLKYDGTIDVVTLLEEIE